MISYKYRCPVCGRMTATAVNMVNHILLRRHKSPIVAQSHRDWITQRVPSMPMHRLKDGTLKLNFKPLIEIVEKECKL